MSRYRTPQPQGSPYITPAGYRRLQQELDALWTRRATVPQALGAAAAEGDRSEDAENIYRKKALRLLARVLLMMTLDDEVSVPTPAGPVVYYIVEVSYGDAP